MIDDDAGQNTLPSASAADLLPPRAARPLSLALAAVTAAAAALSAFLPGVLRGPAVMNGSARGTALVLLLVTVPLLLAATAAGARGSARGLLAWLGAVAHILYQSMLFLFATPFNDLFLLYVAMLGLALWTGFALLGGLDSAALRARIVPGMPTRPIAVFIWSIVGLNALAWLAPIARALAAGGPPAFLEGTGMATNPIFVQDLAFWLPLIAVGAWGMRRGRPCGYVVVGAMLVMWVVEAVTVAVDQALGYGADPASTVASAAGAWGFAALAAISLVPMIAFYRRVGR
jgi:hypothetical protein